MTSKPSDIDHDIAAAEKARLRKAAKKKRAVDEVDTSETVSSTSTGKKRTKVATVTTTLEVLSALPVEVPRRHLFTIFFVESQLSYRKLIDELLLVVFSKLPNMPEKLDKVLFKLHDSDINDKDLCPDLPAVFEAISDPETETCAKTNTLNAYITKHFENQGQLDKTKLSRDQITMFVAMMAYLYYKNLTAFFRCLFVGDLQKFRESVKCIKWTADYLMIYGHLIRAVSIDIVAKRDFRYGLCNISVIDESCQAYFNGMNMCASEDGVRSLLDTEEGATTAFVARSLTMFGSDRWNEREKKRGVITLDHIIDAAMPPKPIMGRDDTRPPFTFVSANMRNSAPMSEVGLVIHRHITNLADAARSEDDKALVWKWVDAYEYSPLVCISKIGSLTHLAIRSNKASQVNRMFSRSDVRASFMLGTMITYISRQVESPDISGPEKMTWAIVLRNFVQSADFAEESHRGGRVMLIASIARDDDLFDMAAEACSKSVILGAKEIMLSVVRRRQLRMFATFIQMPNLDFRSVHKDFFSQLAFTEEDSKEFFNLALKHQSAWFLTNHERARTVLSKQQQTTPLLVALTLFVATKATPDSEVQKQLINYMQRTCEKNGTNEQANNISLCTYCLDRPPNVLLRRCTHLISCSTCWPTVREKGMEHCPMCRTEIDKSDTDWFINAK